MRTLGLEQRVAFAQRLIGLFKQAGYWKSAESRADYQRFAKEHEFRDVTVWRWLNGTVPGIPTLRRLCLFFDVSMDWLLYDDARWQPLPPKRKSKKPVLAGGPMRRRPDPGFKGSTGGNSEGGPLAPLLLRAARLERAGPPAASGDG